LRKKKKEKSPKTKKIYQKDEDKIIPFELDKKGDSKKELIEIKKDVTDKKLFLKDYNSHSNNNKEGNLSRNNNKNDENGKNNKLKVPTSPRLLIPRNSISYDGEFSIKLQQIPENGKEESKENEKQKKIIKDLSCFDSIKVIGKGSFGKVILVRNKQDRQLLALKCIKKQSIINNKNIENIKKEKKILENVDKPFIIKLRFTFQNNIKIFMAFEYYNGGEVFFHLQKHRRFSETLAKFYAAEIYIALKYLHSKKIVYRDLKPENIILDKQGHIKLIDFGLAKSGVSEFNPTETVCGTNEYIPPEVIMGKSYSYSFDWWGFGNILYEMLFGYPAFTDQNKTSLFKKIVYTEPLYRGANLSNDAMDLLKSLLKKDIDKRIKPENIPNHPWFKSINFDEIRNLKVTPPFKPKIKK